MTFIGLKAVVISQFLVICLLLFSSVVPCVGVEVFVPEREIIVSEIHQKPEWMLLWDKARNSVRAGEFSRAAAFYTELLQRKPHIEEANWGIQ